MYHVIAKPINVMSTPLCLTPHQLFIPESPLASVVAIHLRTYNWPGAHPSHE
jgi:hypothetical protein